MEKKLELRIAENENELKITLFKNINENQITKKICQTKFNLTDLNNFDSKSIKLSIQDEN